MLTKGENDRFLEINYGTFEINVGENKNEDEIRIQIRDINNEVKLERVILLESFSQK